MSPIRVGIIGLASKDTPHFAPGEWGVQHLKAIAASPKYTVTAVCNSSVASSQAAIDFHGLPNATAYGSPADLAADPNVDLVVVAVSAAKHEVLAKPVIEAGKDLYLEFPLGHDLPSSEGLAKLAQSEGIRTVAGVQAHSDPAFAKLRELVQSEAVGEVVHSSLEGSVGPDVGMGWLQAARNYLDIGAPANRVDIGLGHLLGGYRTVLGDFAQIQSIYKTQTKSTTLLGADFSPVESSVPVTAPDVILLNGILSSGVTASINLRPQSASVDGTTFRWTITGTQGEIEMSASAMFVNQTMPGTKIVLKRKGEGEHAEEIAWAPEEPEHVSKLEGGALSLARAYEAFAEGRKGDFADVEDGIQVHRTLAKATKNALWA